MKENMDISQVLKVVSPWLASAIAGPFGGMAVTAIADALGLSEKTEASIKSALSGVTPEQMLALKNADQAFALKMKELGYQDIEKMAALAVDNTKDARAMQVATKSKVPAILAVMITVGFFGILIGMMSGKLTVADNQALLLMLGALGAAWGAVVNYFFGSSAESGRTTARAMCFALHVLSLTTRSQVCVRTMKARYLASQKC